MDKTAAHKILESDGIRMAKWKSVSVSELSRLDELCENTAAELEYPLFVKPANSGSSVGVNKASSFEELKNAVKLAFSHDRKVVIEEFVKGREVECAVFGKDNPFASAVGSVHSCEYTGSCRKGNT